MSKVKVSQLVSEWVSEWSPIELFWTAKNMLEFLGGFYMGQPKVDYIVFQSNLIWKFRGEAPEAPSQTKTFWKVALGLK